MCVSWIFMCLNMWYVYNCKTFMSLDIYVFQYVCCIDNLHVSFWYLCTCIFDFLKLLLMCFFYIFFSVCISVCAIFMLHSVFDIVSKPVASWCCLQLEPKSFSWMNAFRKNNEIRSEPLWIYLKFVRKDKCSLSYFSVFLFPMAFRKCVSSLKLRKVH